MTGINGLPWALLADTTVDRHFKPTFPKYLQELDGKQVSLTGFMQPLGEDVELGSFMLIEYPVGCWYCEMPEITGIVLVDLAAGKDGDAHARPDQSHGEAGAERPRSRELPVYDQGCEGVWSRLT